MKTSLHKRLLRQLHRLGMNEDTMPKELSQWQTLLQSINRTYNETDQKRHLLERSKDISSDVTSRKKTEEELQYLHQQLVISARRAGMADVATSILHNVGNVLNSANVSVEMLNEYARCQHFEKLFAASRLLRENKSNLGEYLYSDNKGRLIPLYMLTVCEKLEDIQKSIADEVRNLSKHIRHIKDITAMQQSLGAVTVASEKIFVPEIIDSAFSMCGDIFKNNRIKIKKNYDEQFFLTTDKAKLLQILVNLLQNSRDALVMSGEGRSRLLSLSVKKSGDDYLDIVVQDNGIGISQEVLTKIFAFGYTTKKDGHGFGLHSSALAAKDLGGSLTAESDGINQGARFILNLPIKIASRRNANVPEQKLAYHCD